MTYLPTMRDIQVVVARRFGLSFDEVAGPSRQKTTAYARHLVAFIARNELGLSYPEIGRHSRRDHTTAVNSVRKIQMLLAGRDPSTIRHLADLLAELGLPLVAKEAA